MHWYRQYLVSGSTIEAVAHRLVCPNFGHPALTLSLSKCKFFESENSFATIVNGLSILKLFQLLIGDLYFSFSIYKVRKPRMTSLDQGGIEIKARYATEFLYLSNISECRHRMSII